MCLQMLLCLRQAVNGVLMPYEMMPYETLLLRRVLVCQMVSLTGYIRPLTPSHDAATAASNTSCFAHGSTDLWLLGHAQYMSQRYQ